MMEVEYLDEYAGSDISNISENTNLNSNNINILAPQNRNTMLENKHNNFKEVFNEKENKYRTKKSSVHIEEAKCAKDLKKNEYTLKDSNIRLQKAEEEISNNSEKGKKMSKKELKNTIQVSTKLNNIYEKTYELKKNYYETKIEYLRRFVEAHEKLVCVIFKYNIYTRKGHSTIGCKYSRCQLTNAD